MDNDTVGLRLDLVLLATPSMITLLQVIITVFVLALGTLYVFLRAKSTDEMHEPAEAGPTLRDASTQTDYFHFGDPVNPDPKARPRRPETRGVMVQSQCTYSAVRGVRTPRFQVLPEESSGAWRT